jgi:hypothetical protein
MSPSTRVALTRAALIVTAKIIMELRSVHACLVLLETLRLVGLSVSYHLNAPLIRLV